MESMVLLLLRKIAWCTDTVDARIAQSSQRQQDFSSCAFDPQQRVLTYREVFPNALATTSF